MNDDLLTEGQSRYCRLQYSMGCTEPTHHDGLCEYHDRIRSDPYPRTLNGKPNWGYQMRIGGQA